MEKIDNSAPWKITKNKSWSQTRSEWDNQIVEIKS